MELLVGFAVGSIFSATIAAVIFHRAGRDYHWQPAVELQNGDVISTAKGKNGEWYAFHEKPYICLEGTSRDSVVGLAVGVLNVSNV